jgi:hypothetical protein
MPVLEIRHLKLSFDRMKQNQLLFIPQNESRAKAGQVLPRRDFLRVSTATAAGTILPALLPSAAIGQNDFTQGKSCILLLLVGGPSHLDTFDMKPDAPSEIRGPFRPIRTNVKGIEISEIFPRTAQHADKFAILRSLHNDESARHHSGLTLLETGYSSETAGSGLHIGNVAASLVPLAMGLPMHVRLPGRARHLGEGGADHQATIRSQSARPLPRHALTDVDIARYGRNSFGRNCLLARQLVERGVPFVSIDMFDTVINEPGWDSHGSAPYCSIASYRDVAGPMFDMAYSSLLADLADRGLLETTIVAAIGEFGRSPRLNPAGGRDHWPHCWSALMAGGGVRGGQVVGQSDSSGAFVKERPIRPEEVVATIYHALGIDHRTELVAEDGSRAPVVPKGVHPISELF